MSKKIILSLLLALLLAGGFWAGTMDPAFAADEYEYQVTIYSGNQGTFAGGKTTKVIRAGRDERVTVSVDDLNVKLKSGKYYVKGIRPAGRDSEDAVVIRSQNVTVTEDMAYVVVYGVKGGTVKYTVKYVDASGKELLSPNEYYGAVGDKPIVSFKYVEGYLPNAYNEGKTLKDNEADNVFTFVYTKAGATEEESQGGNQQGGNGGTQQGGNGGTQQGGGNGGTQQGGQNGQGTATVTDQDAPTTPATPQDYVDLDDEEVPLAETPVEEPEAAGWFAAHRSLVFGGIGILAVLIALAAVLGRRKATN